MTWHYLYAYRHIAVDVALVGCDDDMSQDVGLGSEEGGELRRVPDHHAGGDQGGGVCSKQLEAQLTLSASYPRVGLTTRLDCLVSSPSSAQSPSCLTR